MGGAYTAVGGQVFCVKGCLPSSARARALHATLLATRFFLFLFGACFTHLHHRTVRAQNGKSGRQSAQRLKDTLTDKGHLFFLPINQYVGAFSSRRMQLHACCTLLAVACLVVSEPRSPPLPSPPLPARTSTRHDTTDSRGAQATRSTCTV